MKKYGLFFFMAVLLPCCDALAQQGILADVVRQYQAATDGWMAKSLTYAKQLFFLLATIEIAVTSIFLLFQKDGVAEFFASLLVKMLGLLFGYVLLVKAPEWIPAVIQSFTQAGSAISGTATLNPSAVVNQGLRLASSMATADVSLVFSPLVVLTVGLSSLICVISYAVVAGEMLLVLVESYLVIGAGVILLGFWGNQFTQHISVSFLNAVLRVGMRLFTLFLVIGLGLSLQDKFLEVLAAAAQQSSPTIPVYLGVAMGSLVFMLMAWRVPDLAASMLSGGAAMGAGSSVGSALMASHIARSVTTGITRAMSANAQTQRAMTGQDTLKAAAKLGQTGLGGLGGVSREFQGGSSFPTAPGRAAWGISRVNQQFRDSIIRSTERETQPASKPSNGGINRVTPREPPPQNPPDPRETPVSIRFKQ